MPGWLADPVTQSAGRAARRAGHFSRHREACAAGRGYVRAAGTVQIAAPAATVSAQRQPAVTLDLHGSSQADGMMLIVPAPLTLRTRQWPAIRGYAAPAAAHDLRHAGLRQCRMLTFAGQTARRRLMLVGDALRLAGQRRRAAARRGRTGPVPSRSRAISTVAGPADIAVPVPASESKRPTSLAKAAFSWMNWKRSSGFLAHQPLHQCLRFRRPRRSAPGSGCAGPAAWWFPSIAAASFRPGP